MANSSEKKRSKKATTYTTVVLIVVVVVSLIFVYAYRDSMLSWDGVGFIVFSLLSMFCLNGIKEGILNGVMAEYIND